MIHEVLPSDVEFAKKLLNHSNTDGEILECLHARGIEPAKAAQLVDDLRHGREPNIEQEFALGSTAGAPARGAIRPTKDLPRAADTPQPPSRNKKPKRSGVAWWFILVLVAFLWALWYAFFKMGTDTSKE
jgi:hypothetical protein